jgi:hypothetical protein
VYSFPISQFTSTLPLASVWPANSPLPRTIVDWVGNSTVPYDGHGLVPVAKVTEPKVWSFDRGMNFALVIDLQVAPGGGSVIGSVDLVNPRVGVADPTADIGQMSPDGKVRREKKRK